MSKGVVVNVSYCKYTVVRNAIRGMKWDEIDDQEDTTTPWNLWWQDVGVSTDKVMKMRDFQRINHWPGMSSIHTKTGLCATMRRMGKLCPEQFEAIHPQTWSLPEEYADFVGQFDNVNNNNNESSSTSTIGGKTTKKQQGSGSGTTNSSSSSSKKTFIMKPAASCQGRGIYLIRDLQSMQDPRSAQIAQRYVHRPLLIDGLKFDLRIYVLVSSVDPLRIWLFDEGLARFATTPYAPPNASNISKVTQHLTNYAINCQSSNFQFNTGGTENGSTGSKRTLSWFRSWLDANGHGSQLVWGRITDMIIKALLAAQPHLAKTYRSVVGADATSMRCFEVLGLDVLLDDTFKPWLLEVNHSPSLTCDTPLDTQIKYALISETLALMKLKGGDRKRALLAETTAARQRLYGPVSTGGASTEATLGAGGGGAGDDDADSITDSNSTDAGGTGGGGPLIPPPHVRATAASFAYAAAAIPADHAANEVKVAKKYRLVFPPVDPSLVPEAVWKRNAAKHAEVAAAKAERARVQALANSLNSAPSSPNNAKKQNAYNTGNSSSTNGSHNTIQASSGAVAAAARRFNEADEEEDEDEDDAEEEQEEDEDNDGQDNNGEENSNIVNTNSISTAQVSTTIMTPSSSSTPKSTTMSFAPPPPPVPSSSTNSSTASLFAIDTTGMVIDASPTGSGIPKPFVLPWDKNKAIYEARIDRYKVLLAISTELYSIQTAATATSALGGKRVVNAALEATADAIAAAAKTCKLKLPVKIQNGRRAATGTGGSTPVPQSEATPTAAGVAAGAALSSTTSSIPAAELKRFSGESDVQAFERIIKKITQCEIEKLKEAAGNKSSGTNNRINAVGFGPRSGPPTPMNGGGSTPTASSAAFARLKAAAAATGKAAIALAAKNAAPHVDMVGIGGSGATGGGGAEMQSSDTNTEVAPIVPPTAEARAQIFVAAILQQLDTATSVNNNSADNSNNTSTISTGAVDMSSSFSRGAALPSSSSSTSALVRRAVLAGSSTNNMNQSSHTSSYDVGTSSNGNAGSGIASLNLSSSGKVITGQFGVSNGLLHPPPPPPSSAAFANFSLTGKATGISAGGGSMLNTRPPTAPRPLARGEGGGGGGAAAARALRKASMGLSSSSSSSSSPSAAAPYPLPTNNKSSSSRRNSGIAMSSIVTTTDNHTTIIVSRPHTSSSERRESFSRNSRPQSAVLQQQQLQQSLGRRTGCEPLTTPASIRAPRYGTTSTGGLRDAIAIAMGVVNGPARGGGMGGGGGGGGKQL